MADLLECLVQIRALADTPKRLRVLVERHAAGRWTERPLAGKWSPVEIVAHLADAELFFGTRLRLMLTSDRPLLQPFDQDALARRANYVGWPPALAVARFGTRRAETLELLDGASAEDLARVGVHARRGAITVADLVALMLAHDTDHLGQLRERLAAAAEIPSGT